MPITSKFISLKEYIPAGNPKLSHFLINASASEMKDTIKILSNITKRDVEKCLVGMWILMNHMK